MGLTLNLNAGPSKVTRALDPRSAQESHPSPDALLAYGSIASQSARNGNYTEAKRLLGMADRLPVNVEHNLKTYITLMQKLVSALDSLKTRLGQLQNLTDEGAAIQAREKVVEIEDLTAGAEELLGLLSQSLERVETVYHLDVSSQRRDLQVLSITLRSFEQHLGRLSAQLKMMDHSTPTQLELRASPNPVKIEESLRIEGQLHANGADLSDRIVELWVNGTRTANLTLDRDGRFNWTHFVSSNNRLSEVKIYARYSPVDSDLSRFRPTKSNTITVPIKRYPTILTVMSTSNKVKVQENFVVQGYLTDDLGRGLAGIVVNSVIDGRLVNSSSTDASGMYSMSMSFPAESLEGEHQLYTQYQPTQGIYAPVISQKIIIHLFYLRPIISSVALDGVVVLGGRPVAASGQTVRLKGLLEIDSKPFPQGLVIALLENRELGRAVSGTDGFFSVSISIPFDAADEGRFTLVFLPDKPWIASSTTSVVLYVANSVVMGFAIGVITFAVLVFSGGSSRFLSVWRRRMIPRRQKEAETTIVEKSEDRQMALGQTVFCLGGFELQDPRICVKRIYWEVRRVLAQVLGVEGQLSETPREYRARVTERVGVAALSLSSLTELFELSEYSQYALSKLEAQEAISHATRVAKAIDVRIDHELP
jgi:hypothetical protein